MSSSMSIMALSLKKEIVKEMVLHMLQFLDKEGFKESLHRLEQESGLFFNMKYFEEKFLGGEWDEVEKYVSGFTKIDDNRNSMTIYFEIRKHKYLEALIRQDRVKAVEIMMNELQVFSKFNESLFKEMRQLLTLKDIRENEKLSEYGDTMKTRNHILIGLKKLIEANPLIREKLAFPTLETSRLMTLINQRNTDTTMDNVNDKMKPWRFVETVSCRMITLPESKDAANKVAGLLYTHKGEDGLLALGSNGILKFWKWTCSDQNPSGKATANNVSGLKNPKIMKNDVSNINLEEAVPCMTISKNGTYVVSATGGEVYLFSLRDCRVMTAFMAPPPASTCLAFDPLNNNIIAVGMEDSIIYLFDVSVREVKKKLKGHQKSVTGLAFSTSLKILVSSGADGQLCVWNTYLWIQTKSVTLRKPAGIKATACNTRVQFHSDSVRLLVSNGTQLAIYDASNMNRLWQWLPQYVLSAPISSAVYSCDSLLVYASFLDGNVGVFDANTLTLRCRVFPSAYLSQAGLNRSVYPMVIATHPQHPNQFAIGLSDGSVKVIEPADSEGKWGVDPVAAPMASASNHGRP